MRILSENGNLRTTVVFDVYFDNEKGQIVITPIIIDQVQQAPGAWEDVSNSRREGPIYTLSNAVILDMLTGTIATVDTPKNQIVNGYDYFISATPARLGMTSLDAPLYAAVRDQVENFMINNNLVS